LNEVERDIVIKHLGLINDIPMNYVAIGEHYRRTPEWARQVYVKAMKKVKLAARKSKAYVR